MNGRALSAIAAVAVCCLVAPAAILAGEPAAVLKPTPADVVTLRTGDKGPAEAAAVTLMTGGAARQAEAGASATTQVKMGDYFYNPKDLTISAGDTVRWTNNGDAAEGHTVTGDGFDSGVMHEGDTYTHTFDEPGSFEYVCTLHPNMTGSVTATSSGTGDDGGDDQGADGGTPGSDGGDDGSGGASASPGGSSAGGDSGGSLASTGLNLLLLAEIGACVFALGLLVRRLLYA